MGFFRLVFSSFFRWWWAAITGFASIASWLFVSRGGVLLTPLVLSILVLVGLTLLFLVFSTVYQGWLIYKGSLTRVRIVGFQKCDSYDGEYVFLLEGNIGNGQGLVVELRRFLEGVEVPIALAEIMEKNSKGQYQARSIWIAPEHHRELKMGRFVYSEIEVELSVQLRTILRAKDQIIESTG